jgi:uncharacterized protein (DUF362 family)
MKRIATPSVLAQVVNLEPIGNWPDEQQMRDAVDVPRPVIESDYPISSPIVSTHPVPATGGLVNFDAVQ